MSFISFDKINLIRGKSNPISLDNAEVFLSLFNCNVYWVIPKVCTNYAEIPDNTQYLLWKKDDGSYGIMLPLVDGDIKADLQGDENGICVIFKGAVEGSEPDMAELLYIDSGIDPYELSYRAISEISKRLGSFKMRNEKKIPKFLDYIGWCTWDAFYGSVDAEKIIMGLESFKKANFPLGYIILDDGAWDSYYDYLNQVRLCTEKFPNGIKSLVTLAKEKYNLKLFGIWHCFEGYWGGINPDAELAKRYSYIINNANIRPWEEIERCQDIYLISPDEVEKFYEELHSYIYEMGIDMVKIDGQSTMDLFTDGKLGMASSMKKYQQAMQKTAEKYFDSMVIHCMSNSNDVAYNMMTTNCWRNSYDYAPKDLKMQKEHIYINAANAMWSSTFSVPDWDMFQTHSAGAEIHAAARAISGGPVYVCDYPDKQNFDILNSLITSEGKVLRCQNPALLTEDCIFSDCRTEKKLMKIFNKNGEIGIIGIFYCNEQNEVISGKFSSFDIKGLEGEKFAVYYFTKKKVDVVSKGESLNISLGDGEFELVTFSPIDNGIAPFGLVDKYNSSAAIISAKWENEKYCTKLSDGGTSVFYCENQPFNVLCNNKKANYSYDKKSCLLSINSDKYGENEINVIFN
ncbi:MAG: alpha-galactosidase [Clostridiales bacterium]|nr:alpha-galactosidase [Clostridiales bacterium]